MDPQLIGPIIGLVAVLIAVGAVTYGVYRARKATREFSRMAFGTDTLAEGFAKAEDKARNTPKSVSALTSIALPRIMKDFPEFDYQSMRARATNCVTSYLLAVTRSDSKLLAENSHELRDQLRLHLAGLKEADRRESYDQVKVHRTEISEYRKEDGRCTVVFQCSLQSKHAVEEADGTVFRGSKDLWEQSRWEVELSYIQDFTKLKDASGSALGITCPRCGAPVSVLGAKTCEYCGSAIQEINVRAWTFISVRES